ncbi:MAG: CAP domain-containing protein [Candidatus Alcyoniella australis]|nr:CAP domain-containing protein [Candidatus Alcyoniella australis]
MRTLKIVAALLVVAGLFGGDHPRYISDYYNAPAPRVEISKDEQQVADRVNDALRSRGLTILSMDPRMVLVCRHISAYLQANGIERVDVFDSDEIKRQLNDAGVTDGRIMIHLGNSHGVDEFIGSSLDKLVEQVRNAGMTHVGVGVVSGGMLSRVSFITLIMTKRPVLLGTLPRKVAGGTRQSLSIAPARGVKNVGLHFSDPAGRELPVELRGAAGGKRFAELNFNAGGGAYTIEVTFEGDYGPEVGALFQVQCQGPAAAQSQASVSPYTEIDWDIRNEQEAEDLILMLINDERISAGLTPLTLYGPLSDVARGHSRDMAQNNFVGHLSPGRGDVSDRVDAAGIKWSRVTENIARAETIQDAHRGLMGSPVHRRNVIDSEVNFVGIGVVFIDGPYGGRQVLVTVDFLAMR